MQTTKRTFAYNKHWSDRFASIADVELTVEECRMPVHSPILSQSDTFCRIFLDPKNPQNHKLLANIFKGSKVEDIDLLLSHVYSTREAFKPEILCKLAKLAGDFGFKELRERVLNYVTMNKEAKKHVHQCLRLLDVGKVKEWLGLAQDTDHEGLRKEMGIFLANNYGVLLRGNDARWKWVREWIEDDAIIWEAISDRLYDI